MDRVRRKEACFGSRFDLARRVGCKVKEEGCRTGDMQV